MKQILLALALIAAPVFMFTVYEATARSTSTVPAGLGDMSQFETIVSDVQALVEKGDIAGARTRITDYESAWDGAETALRPLNQELWLSIDAASDGALRAVRSSKPAADQMNAKLTDLMSTLQASAS